MTQSLLEFRLRLVLAVLLAVCTAPQLRYTVDNVGVLLRTETPVETPFVLRPFTHTVAAANEGARNAGLLQGDVVQQVNGRALRGAGDLARPLAAARPGDTLTVDVARLGSVQTIPIVLTARAPRRFSAGDWALFVGLGIFTPWLCLALGFGVVFLRPRDGRAWLLLLLMVAFSQVSDRRFDDVNGWGALAATLAQGYSSLMEQLWPLGMLLFGLYFPDRFDFDRRRPWLKWLLIVPLLAHALQTAVHDAIAVTSLEGARQVRALLSIPAALRVSLVMVAIGLFFAAMWYRRFAATTPDTRRRLSLLLWGTNLSLSPMGALFTASQIRGREIGEFPASIVFPVLMLLVGFPITLAYVIVVERALDVRVVVRQGLQYALAKNGILAMQILVSAVIIFAAASLATNPGVNRPRIITILAAGVMFVFVTRLAAERVRAFTDRRFFREAYDAEQILGELGDTVRTIVETGPLLDMVTRRIQESLHVPRVMVLLRQGEEFRESRPAPALAAHGPLAERLRTLQPVLAYSDEPEATALGAELLLPLAVKDQLLGVLALGPKQSEAPYSKSDLRLLQSVATQTALALENSRLTAAVASEVALRARMSREVEIAREVQERLFPQNRPAIAGLDYAGACRPALGVGGDYFDFLELPGGRLGLAIGDVSGKGISAALLMASLQASLRGQSLAGSIDLAALMGNVNQLIYEASQSNRYATFFYGTYDPADRHFHYVNAGHNAPMLLRGNGGALTVQRLDQGGPVIGMLYPVPYVAATVPLEPGDLLVAYTDGISEAMNGADEEWGEERLQAVAAGSRELDADALVTRIFAAADAFVAGAKQHDDMTLVVARVQPNS
jgi:phosphoserine phosphatase RsbU/P